MKNTTPRTNTTNREGSADKKYYLRYGKAYVAGLTARWDDEWKLLDGILWYELQLTENKEDALVVSKALADEITNGELGKTPISPWSIRVDLRRCPI